MKRFLVMVLSLGLLAASLGTAEARKSKRVERTVQGSYSVNPTPVTGCHEALGPWACLIVETKHTEGYFTADVTDLHGQPVLVNVYSRNQHHASFCGKTTQPIAFVPGATLEFDIGQGRGPIFVPAPSCPERMIKTTGTIKVTLSNQR